MTHRSCEICGREFWEGDCEPLAGAPAYCTRCAEMACEMVWMALETYGRWTGSELVVVKHEREE